MDLQERLTLVYRIISGRTLYNILNNEYIIYSPNIDVLFDAQQFYDNIIDDYKYEEWLSTDDCLKCLVYNGICSSDIESKIKNLENGVDDYKINIYKSFFNSRQRDILKKELLEVNDEMDKLEYKRHSLDHFTLLGFATILRQQYILSKTFYNKNNTLVFDNFDSINFSLLHLIHANMNALSIDSHIYRELARTEPWCTYWRANRENVLGKCSTQLTIEQRYLVLYSRMYDNVAESPEEPIQEIINDDDALDGWFLLQKQKKDNERKDKLADNMLNIQPNSQEVFIPAQTPEDISRIEGLNTVESKIVKAQREVVISKLGTVIDSNLPDKRREIQQKAMEQFKTGISHG